MRVLPLRNRLIQIQQYVRHVEPGGQVFAFDTVRDGGLVDQLVGCGFVLSEAIPLLLKQTQKVVGFGGGRLARQSRAPGVFDPPAVAYLLRRGSVGLGDVNACSGVLVRLRVTTQAARSGASKLTKLGYGALRRQMT